ncbi:MAG: hypothetical protein Kow0069_28680 [Promethearchaeota archaeon]
MGVQAVGAAGSRPDGRSGQGRSKGNPPQPDPTRPNPIRVASLCLWQSPWAFRYEDGFNVAPGGDPALAALGARTVARVDVPEVGPDVRRRLVLSAPVGGGNVEIPVACIMAVVVDPGERSGPRKPVDSNLDILSPEDHFASQRSFAAGLTELPVPWSRESLAAAGIGSQLAELLVGARLGLVDAVLSHPKAPAEFLERLATSADATVRKAVAGSSRTPPGALERLAGGDKNYVRLAVVGNPRAPEAAVRLAWEAATALDELRAALSHPNRPAEVDATAEAAYLRDHPGAGDLDAARDGEAPRPLLVRLAKHLSSVIRDAAVSNLR